MTRSPDKSVRQGRNIKERTVKIPSFHGKTGISPKMLATIRKLAECPDILGSAGGDTADADHRIAFTSSPAAKVDKFISGSGTGVDDDAVSSITGGERSVNSEWGNGNN